jgi:beta-lactamase regulating signal transducer with metallopeptidase domain
MIMSENWIFLTSELLVTYWIHSSIFIGTALIALRLKQIAPDAVGESLIKLALFLAIATSLLQVAQPFDFPQSPQFLKAEWQVKQSPSQQISKHNNQTSLGSSSMPNIPIINLSDLNQSGLNQSSLAHPSLTQSSPNESNFALASPNLASPIPSTHNPSTHSQQKINQAIVNQSSIAATPTQFLLNRNNVPTLITLGWLSIAFILLASKVIQQFKLKRLLTCRQTLTNKQVMIDFDQLLKTTSLSKNIRLSESTKIGSPIALANNEIVLPANFTSNFTRSQIQAALAHELAHIKRKDGLWLWLCLLNESVFFFQPLNKLLNKNIYQFAEHRSDDLAALWTGNPRALAEALSIAANSTYETNQLKMVPTMSSNKSTLLARVESLIINQKNKTKRLALALAGFLSAFIFLMAPGISINAAPEETLATKSPVAPVAPVASQDIKTPQPHKPVKVPEALNAPKTTKLAKTNSRNIYKTGNGSNFTMNSNHNGINIKIEAKMAGELRFNDQETEILDFPENSELDITYDDDENIRRLIINRKSGEAQYTFYDDNNEQPYDEKAKQWFASVIPEILRTTGFNAKSRVARIKKIAGDEGVLAEVDLIGSDYIEATYMVHLFNLSKLSDKNIRKSFKAMQDIGSDFEMARALKTMVKTQVFSSAKIWRDFFDSAESIGSDFELAGVLKTSIPYLNDDEVTHKAYFNASKEIGSDFEMRGVFVEFLEQHKAGDEALIAMFTAADNIGSDFEMASLLIKSGEKLGDSDSVFQAYLNASKEIGSDFEMSKVFKSLLANNISDQQLASMLDIAADNIGSDFELADLLMKVLDNYQLNDNTETAFRDAITSVGSRFEKGKVTNKLFDKTN